MDTNDERVHLFCLFLEVALSQLKIGIYTTRMVNESRTS